MRDVDDEELDDTEEEDEEIADILFDSVDEEGSTISDLKEAIKSLYKTLDYDQKEELNYILDNIESIPWD